MARFRDEKGREHRKKVAGEIAKRTKGRKGGVPDEARAEMSLAGKVGYTVRGIEQRTKRPAGRPSRKLKDPKPE
jgi:hypothetical protein